MSGWDWLPRSLGSFASLLVAALLPSACYRGQELGIKHQHLLFTAGSRLLLIDDRNEHVADGGVSPDPIVIAFELLGQRELWRTVVPSRFVAPSSNARFATVLGPPVAPYQIRVGVLDLESGKFRDMGVVAPDRASDAAYRVATAISDDGAFFASVLDGQLRVWDTANGRLAGEQQFADSRAAIVRFVDGGHDLTVALAPAPALDQHLVSLVVLTQTASGWQAEKRLDAVRAFAWTTRGLMYADPAGVSRYDRRESRLLAAGMKLAGGVFSADGRYAGYRTEQGLLNVYDFDTSRVVLSAAWQPSLKFHGAVVTAMVDGKLWRGDLSTGNSKVLRDFGVPAETVKIPLFGGSSTKVHYDYLLNQDGTLLYYREPGNGTARVYAVDQL